MFVLAVIYLVILVVLAIFSDWNERRFNSGAQVVLFTIIGIVLFWTILNK